MRTPWPPPFRPHEVIFGGFLLVTAARLLATGGAASPWPDFVVMAVSIVAMAKTATRWPSATMARLRLALFPVLVNVVYWQLGPVVNELGSHNWDAALLRADRMFLTDTPAVLLGAWTPPLLTDFLSGCYLLFFPGVLAAFLFRLSDPMPPRAKYSWEIEEDLAREQAARERDMYERRAPEDVPVLWQRDAGPSGERGKVLPFRRPGD